MTKGRTHGRRGVALILVLGMLALMLIMATAFSVMMRTEHAGSANFADEIRSKHVVWAALAHAVAKIEESIPKEDVYPPWIALGPQGTNLVENTADSQVNLVWGKAGDFVPGQLHDTAADAFSNWLVDSESGARYSYLVLNCSGLLDGNYVAGSNRMAGVHPAEVVVSGLLDVKNTADLVRRRDIDLRYESLREFNLFQCTTPDGGLRDGYSDNFIVGTYYPQGWWSGGTNDPVKTDQLDIGGDAEKIDKAQFISKLTQACTNDVDPEFVYNQLMHYLDEDSELTTNDLASPCTELVPMFNEVQLEYQFDTNRVRYAVWTEWIFPFLRPSEHKFHIEQSVVADVYTNNILVVSKQPDSGTVDSGYAGSGGASTDWIDIKRGPLFTMKDLPAVPDGTPIKLDVWVQLRMLLNGAEELVVDEVPSPWRAPEAGFALSVTNVVGTRGRQDGSYEVIDPRFNWQIDLWRQQVATQSMGYANIATTDHFESIRNDPGRVKYDRDAVMHVSDAGRLNSVAELGHLLCKKENQRSNYHRTIRVYSLEPGDFHDLFRHFTVKDAPSYGLVNMNTEYTSILRTAIENMPMGYPGNPKKVSPADVTTIVNTIAARGNIETLSYLTTMSALCSNTTWRTVLPDWSEVERDAMVAYTAGLLGTRQNLFTVLLMGGPATQGMGLTGTQEQGWFGMRRAVAVVWRDPFPIQGAGNAGDPRHRYVLRYFNWLDE